jgi:hypothetical protein
MSFNLVHALHACSLYVYTTISIAMEQYALEIVNSCWETRITSYLEASGGQNSNAVHFSTPLLIRHLWQLKIVGFLHKCLLFVVVMASLEMPCLLV